MAGSMLSEAERSHLDERGFVVLEDAITADQADALRDRSMALARQERAASDEHVYLGEKAQRVWNLVDKGEVFERAIQHPRVLGAMTWLLGADCTLSSFTVNVIGAGAPAGNLHIDHPLGTLPTPRPAFRCRQTASGSSTTSWPGTAPRAAFPAATGGSKRCRSRACATTTSCRSPGRRAP